MFAEHLAQLKHFNVIIWSASASFINNNYNKANIIWGFMMCQALQESLDMYSFVLLAQKSHEENEAQKETTGLQFPC